MNRVTATSVHNNDRVIIISQKETLSPVDCTSPLPRNLYDNNNE